MGTLDIFVTHGELIWAALLGGVLLLGAYAPSLRTRRRVRRRAAAERDELGAVVEAPDPGDEDAVVVLEGRLVVKDAAVPAVEDGAPAAAFSLDAIEPPTPRGGRRADRLVLETEAGPVELEGPIEVRAGSRELWCPRPFHRLPSPLRARAKAAADVDDDTHLIVRSVGDGDRVRVRGVARRSAARSEGTYREAESGWTLGPVPTHDDDGSVALVALDPVRVRVRGIRRYFWGVVAAAHLFVGLSWVVGAAAIGPAEDGSAAAARVATCTPFHRSAALDAIERALESRGGGLTPERVSVRALRFGSWGCALGLAPGQDPVEYAHAVTEACGSYLEHDRLALLYLNEGRLQAASDAATRAREVRSTPIDGYMYWHDHLPLHLLAGDFVEAAAAAQRGAAYESSEHRPEHAARLRCVARDLAREPGAPNAADDRLPACAILRAARAEGDAGRLEALDGCGDCPTDRLSRRADWLWRFGARCAEDSNDECRALLARAPHWRAIQRLIEGRPTYVGALPVHEQDLIDRLGEAPALPTTGRVAHALSTLALAEYALVSGDFERAAELAARAEVEWEGLVDQDPGFWLAPDEEELLGPARAFEGLHDPPRSAADAARASRRLRVLTAVWSGDLERARELAGDDDPLSPLLELTDGPRLTAMAVADVLDDRGRTYLAGLFRMRRVFGADFNEHIAQMAILGAVLDDESRVALVDAVRIDPTFPSQDARYNLARRVRERVVLRAYGDAERTADAEIEALRSAFGERDRELRLHVVYD